MKKLIIDCSRPIGEQESVIEIEGEEKENLLAISAIAEAKALEPKPKTAEERIAELEARIAQIEGAEK